MDIFGAYTILSAEGPFDPQHWLWETPCAYFTNEFRLRSPVLRPKYGMFECSETGSYREPLTRCQRNNSKAQRPNPAKPDQPTRGTDEDTAAAEGEVKQESSPLEAEVSQLPQQQQQQQPTPAEKPRRVVRTRHQRYTEPAMTNKTSSRSSITRLPRLSEEVPQLPPPPPTSVKVESPSQLEAGNDRVHALQASQPSRPTLIPRRRRSQAPTRPPTPPSFSLAQSRPEGRVKESVVAHKPPFRATGYATYQAVRRQENIDQYKARLSWAMQNGISQ